jgi:hypothetical protein
MLYRGTIAPGTAVPVSGLNTLEGNSTGAQVNNVMTSQRFHSNKNLVLSKNILEDSDMLSPMSSNMARARDNPLLRPT